MGIFTALGRDKGGANRNPGDDWAWQSLKSIAVHKSLTYIRTASHVRQMPEMCPRGSNIAAAIESTSCGMMGAGTKMETGMGTWSTGSRDGTWR